MVFRILVADDQDDCRQAIVQTLHRPGFEVLTAADGSQALRLLLQTTFDLTVLDVHMPSLTGIQILGHLKCAGVIVPSILMTGNPSTAIETAALELGAITMLRKPVPTEILRITVEQIISNRH
jgi:two-component system, OmpR family, response regulator